MIKRRALAPLAASLLAWPALARAQGAAAAPLAASLFFQNPQFSSARLSPDGTRVAFLVAAPGGNLRLGVLDLQTMMFNLAVGIKDADVATFDWVNDQRLVFSQGTGRWGNNLFAVNHDGSGYTVLQLPSVDDAGPNGERGLLPFDTRLIHINGRRKSDHVYVVTPRQNNKERGVTLFELRRVNTVTRFAEVLDSPQHAHKWFMDSDDVLRAVVSERDGQGSFDVRQPDGSFKPLYTFNARDPVRSEPRPVAWAPDGSVYAVAPALADKAGIYTYDVNEAQLAVQPLLASKDFDLWPTLLANDERVLGLRYTVDAEVTLWLDPQLLAHQATIDALLPATTNRVSVAQRPTQPVLLVQSYSDTQPELSFIFNTQTRKLTRLGAQRPGVDADKMALLDPVRIKARDGLEIPAWLTLPRGTEKLNKKNLPLVVLVHGGPWGLRQAWQWMADAQFLASRGYAVIQPESRGVTGYGSKHFKAGWKQWGLSMQADLADAARWAVNQGIADPRRIAIMGDGRGGYGGYAAMMGLAADPSLYRCAINYMGVADLGMLFSVDWDSVTDEGKRTYAHQVGDPVADAAQFKATSPLQHAARITQPVLLAYRGWDPYVPLVHGEKLRDALKPHNANVEWVVYEDEFGPGWGGLEARLDFWGRVERFLAKNLAVTP
jgi:dipeptidyl aminopeptidase/acylaminoacyl peptidase